MTALVMSELGPGFIRRVSPLGKVTSSRSSAAEAPLRTSVMRAKAPLLRCLDCQGVSEEAAAQLADLKKPAMPEAAERLLADKGLAAAGAADVATRVGASAGRIIDSGEYAGPRRRPGSVVSKNLRAPQARVVVLRLRNRDRDS